MGDRLLDSDVVGCRDGLLLMCVGVVGRDPTPPPLPPEGVVRGGLPGDDVGVGIEYIAATALRFFNVATGVGGESRVLSISVTTSSKSRGSSHEGTSAIRNFSRYLERDRMSVAGFEVQGQVENKSVQQNTA